MAAVLKRCCDKYPHFQKRIHVEEEKAQKDNRFLRGSQISYLIYEFTKRGALAKGKEQNSYTEWKTGECFQRKTIGFCSYGDICNFLHTYATEDREDNEGRKFKTHEILTWSKHTLQYRK